MFTRIKPDDLLLKPHDQFMNKWLLLTSGDFASKNYNMMTVAWGSIGTMWNKPVAMTVVRPSRFTYGFMEKFDNFTLCGFPPEMKKDLNLIGGKSGRIEDKIEYPGLRAIASETVSSPSYLEANLILECKKIYYHDINKDNILDSKIGKSYQNGDFHRMYYGEITNILIKNDYL